VLVVLFLWDVGGCCFVFVGFGVVVFEFFDVGGLVIGVDEDDCLVDECYCNCEDYCCEDEMFVWLCV